MTHNRKTLSASRRDLMKLAGTTLAVSAMPTLIPAIARANSTIVDTGTAMIDRANTLLALLDEAQSGTARFDVDSPTRQRWNFMGYFSAKPGLPMERMNAAQKAATLDLLATGLNRDGMQKAEDIMVLQEVLRENGGIESQNKDRFSIAIFGNPGADNVWAWRFEGHHLSLSFTLNGTDVISVTPSSFSSNPNEVTSGPYAGLVALKGEDSYARQLYGDLTGRNRERALIREQAFGNILTRAGREDMLQDTPRQGVPLGDLTETQQQLAMRLIEVYAVDHLNDTLAMTQKTRLLDEDRGAMTFGWAGSDQVGEMRYYRLHGDHTLIEFASLNNRPMHLHTIRHDLQRNLGQHAI
jgi:hypothetical protein